MGHERLLHVTNVHENKIFELRKKVSEHETRIEKLEEQVHELTKIINDLKSNMT